MLLITSQASKCLKRCVTSLVVVDRWMVAMLNRSGYRVYEAWKAVNDNNMTKFSASQTDGYYTLAGYEATNNGSYELRQVDIDKWGCFNDNNKLMKPIGYTKISVKEFTPQRKEQDVLYKIIGSVEDSYYAVDEEGKVIIVLTSTIIIVIRKLLQTMFALVCSVEIGSYDVLAVEELKEYEKISKSEWAGVKADFIAYLKHLG